MLPRHSHSCSVLKFLNPDTGVLRHVALVAGGRVDKSTENQTQLKDEVQSDLNKSVELLFLDVNTVLEWQPGPQLPHDAEGPVMVATESSVVLATGRRLLQLSIPFENWSVMEQELQISRKYSSAVLVPDGFVKCIGLFVKKSLGKLWPMIAMVSVLFWMKEASLCCNNCILHNEQASHMLHDIYY